MPSQGGLINVAVHVPVFDTESVGAQRCECRKPVHIGLIVFCVFAAFFIVAIPSNRKKAQKGNRGGFGSADEARKRKAKVLGIRKTRPEVH